MTFEREEAQRWPLHVGRHIIGTRQIRARVTGLRSDWRTFGSTLSVDPSDGFAVARWDGLAITHSDQKATFAGLLLPFLLRKVNMRRKHQPNFSL